MIAVYAPGSVSNVACGFDIMGFALDEPGDVVVAAPRDEPGVSIAAIHGDGGRLTTDPRKNTASAAVMTLLQRLETTRGVSLTIHKGLPLASGIGSSGASAVAAVVAANELLGRPAPMPMLLECAMAGEQAGCGAVHPDNVTPSLYGGFILARSAQPPDIVRLPVPDGLACAVLHPRMEIETGAARRLIGDQVPLKDATRQWANVGGLVAALYTSDLALLSRSLVDHIAEPKRASLVPGSRRDQIGGDVRRRARLQPVGLGTVGLCAGRDARHRARGRRSDAARLRSGEHCRIRSLGVPSRPPGRARHQTVKPDDFGFRIERIADQLSIDECRIPINRSEIGD